MQTDRQRMKKLTQWRKDAAAQELSRFSGLVSWHPGVEIQKLIY
jgi:hypothetical protein